MSTRRQQFEMGARTIRSALEAGLAQAGATRPSATPYRGPIRSCRTPRSRSWPTARSRSCLFPNEQVTDSAERLDSFASTRSPHGRKPSLGDVAGAPLEHAAPIPLDPVLILCGRGD